MAGPAGLGAPRPRRPLKWVKAAVSFLLLGALLYHAHLGTVAGRLAGARPAWIGAALGFFFLNLLAVCYRWQLLLREAGVRVPFARVLSFTLVGLFFNNFLPSGMGGDVVRAFDVARYCGDKFRSVSSIVMTRLVGLAASVPLGFASLAWAEGHGYLPRGLAAPLALALALEGACVALAFSRRAVGWAFRLARGRGKGNGKAKESLGKLHAALAFYLDRRRALFEAMGMAVVAQFATVTSIACLGRALGIEASFVHYLLFTLLIGNVSMLPVSVNGLGVRESGYVILFGAVGVATPACVSLSLAVFLMKIFFSLMGGIVVALRRGPEMRQPAAESARALAETETETEDMAGAFPDDAA